VAKVPEAHRPHGTPRQILDAFWPAIRKLLAWSQPALNEGHPLPVKYWPFVFGLVARQYIDMAKDVLDPRLAVTLIMEAAVPMSKVDPKAVPQELRA
jgi:hypothetical protein